MTYIISCNVLSVVIPLLESTTEEFYLCQYWKLNFITWNLCHLSPHSNISYTYWSLQLNKNAYFTVLLHELWSSRHMLKFWIPWLSLLPPVVPFIIPLKVQVYVRQFTRRKFTYMLPVLSCIADFRGRIASTDRLYWHCSGFVHVNFTNVRLPVFLYVCAKMLLAFQTSKCHLNLIFLQSKNALFSFLILTQNLRYEIELFMCT